jgi:hypothetical protein
MNRWNMNPDIQCRNKNPQPYYTLLHLPARDPEI